MIEKVARALCRHQGFDPDAPGPQVQGERILPYWQHMAPFARAAIEAMRKPPAAVIAAAEDAFTPYCEPGAEQYWEAMISAALRTP